MRRVLVIGAGTMGRVHFEAYEAMEGVEVAGIVDFQKEKAMDVSGKIKVFSSVEEAIEMNVEADVIDVCLPTFLHKEFVIKAADLGKDVICEKPLARSLKDAREMIDYCDSKNVKLFVGHVVRFFPEYQKAKNILEPGEIGNAAVVRTRRGGAFPSAWNDWYADYQNSGGLVLDMIIHDFDFLRWCFGEVERVYAKSLFKRNVEKKDYALVTLRFQNGVIAHVEGSWAHESFSMAFEISGTDGIIEYDSAKETPVVAQIHHVSEKTGGVAIPVSPLRENPYYRELHHFIECLNTGTEPLVSNEDAYKAMEISLAALESMETGKPVVLNGKEESSL